jgi:hypothetical protein
VTVHPEERTGTTRQVLQEERLVFDDRIPPKVMATTPSAQTIYHALLTYPYNKTPAANDAFASREGADDDLILAVALACWFGECCRRSSAASLASGPSLPRTRADCWRAQGSAAFSVVANPRPGFDSRISTRGTQRLDGSFLHRPLAATVDEPTGDRPGRVIGPYKLSWRAQLAAKPAAP